MTSKQEYRQRSMKLRWTALTTISLVTPALAFVAFMFALAISIYSGLPLAVIYAGIAVVLVLWVVGLWSARLWTPAQKAAWTLVVAAAFGLFFAAVWMTPTFFEPMFRNTVNVGGWLPANVILFAVGVLGLVVGFFWLRRVVDVEPERTHNFRASADPNRWLTVGLVGALTLIAVAIFLPILSRM